MTEINKYKTKEREQLISIGNRLRQLRLDNKYTQSQVALHLECKQDRVSRIENGTARLSIGDIYTLCSLYGTTPNEIFGYPPEKLKQEEIKLFIEYRELKPADRKRLQVFMEQFFDRR